MTSWTRQRKPSNTAPPVISGQDQVQQTLTTSAGTWSGVQPFWFSYRWKRCDAGGGNCSKISGATDWTYTAVAADTGHTLRVTVTASNVSGSSSATSTATSVVGAAVAPAFTVAPSSTAPPVVSGQVQAQQTLTATAGSWSGTLPMSFAYQWQSCDSGGANCTSIPGATGASYTVADADVGSTLEVTVTASNSAGTASASSVPTSPVVAAAPIPPVPPSNTVAPTISGQALLQLTLTATTGSWSGTLPMSFAYQWQRCDSAGANCLIIAGATGSSYTVADADLGSTLEVAVTASNSAGASSASSAPTSPVGAPAPAPAAPSSTAAPAVSGQAQARQTLSATTGSWSGTLPMTFAFQWQRCDSGGASCTSIGGATNSSYTVADADVGFTLRVAVTASNSAGSATATSAVTSPVGAAPAPTTPPANTALPVVSGQAQVQQTLTATTGTWSGTQPISFAYQWVRCDASTTVCSSILGATSSSYTAALVDVGSTLEVTVIASNSAGSASATSAATSAVAAAPVAPSNTAPPAISGQAKVQQTLTATTGSWSGTLPMSFAYQWQRCNSSGASCANISGATSASYTAVTADAGSTLKVSVTASNSVGSATATSAATSTVASNTSTSTSNHLYWGAWIGSQLTGSEAPWDLNAITSFESIAGKGLSLVNWSSSFTNCGNPCHFQTAQYDTVRQHGAIPFFSWGSTGFTDAQIASGLEDSYITMWANEAKSWGHPFFLRFNWEMNGNWFDWGVGKNGNTAADYVAAWRHVHDIFTSVGALNVTWVWCPNVDPNNIWASLASVYPGDAYVDWTCLDGYNFNTPWMSFDQLYSSTYKQVVTTIAPSKPMVVGETASTEAGGSKATWITDMLTTQLPTRYPQIKAFLWFDKYEGGMDWPIESSSTAEAAFAAGIASSAYASNQFASLSGGTIQPLP